MPRVLGYGCCSDSVPAGKAPKNTIPSLPEAIVPSQRRRRCCAGTAPAIATVPVARICWYQSWAVVITAAFRPNVFDATSSYERSAVS